MCVTHCTVMSQATRPTSSSFPRSFSLCPFPCYIIIYIYCCTVKFLAYRSFLPYKTDKYLSIHVYISRLHRRKEKHATIYGYKILFTA